MNDKIKITKLEINPLDYIETLINNETIKIEGLNKEQLMNYIRTYVEYDSSITNKIKSKSNGNKFNRVEHCYHDGTLVFYNMLLTKLIIPLIKKESCHTFQLSDSIVDIKYKIGDITQINNLEPINPPKPWMIRTTMYIPVISEVTYEEKER